MMTALLVVACSSSVAAPPATKPQPIIDMHLHALWWGPSLIEPLSGFQAPATDEQLRQSTVEALKRYNIVKAIASGPKLTQYEAAAPERIIAGLGVGSVLEGPLQTDADSLRKQIQDNGYEAIAEFAPQYDGIAPNDSRLEIYYSVAEQMDIPVGIHIGLGPPGAAYVGYPRYRMALSNPLLLEDVLIKHPRLRLYVMHAGWPMLDEMLGLLYAHPQVYVDIAVIDWALPQAEFHTYLRRLVEAGFAKRIMFGSDQMMWPQAFEKAIKAVQSAPFLTAEQKRDIFYNNAATFLKLKSRS